MNTINEEAFARITKATVSNLTSGTLGVLIEGHCILTAASAIKYDPHGEPLSEQTSILRQVFETFDGSKLEARPLVVDFACDLALFRFAQKGKASWVSSEELERLDEAFLQTEPAPLFRGSLPTEETQRIWALDQRNEWIWGTAETYRYDDSKVMLSLTDTKGLPTLGGPVVTDDGELVTIIPHLDVDGLAGSVGKPHLALPIWVMDLITASQTRGGR